jgi:cell division protein FtsW
MLTAVLVMGHSSKGAQRWLGVGPLQIQPSELAKIFMIIALAVFLVSRLDEIREFDGILDEKYGDIWT